MPVTSKMTCQPIAWEAEVPAGTYFMGDPCYGVPEDLWEPLLESCGNFDSSAVGAVDGTEVLAFNAFGSENGKDQYGTEYTVDAGMIGLVPESLFTRAKYDVAFLNQLGQVVTFKEPVTCAGREGILTFGHYTITPDPYLGDDEDEDE